MFHYRIFGGPEAVFATGGCCNLLQTASVAGSQSKLLQTVHKRLQSVSNPKEASFRRP
jgi:hypothetical protein